MITCWRVGACLLTGWMLCCAAAASLSAPPDPGEWTRFRGPNGTGVSRAPNLPSVWTNEDYRWKVALPGSGHASPVIWGDRVFVVCADEPLAKRIVLCLKATDGRLAWQREYACPSSRKNRDNSYASSTPAVDRDRVYVYWTTPEEVKFEFEEPQWGITPGQALVCYDGERLLGGGWIKKAQGTRSTVHG